VTTSGPANPIPLTGGSANSGTVTATFTDVNVGQTHTCTINWGDPNNNTTNNYSFSESAGSGTCSGNHTYSASGVYTVTLTINDGCTDGTGTFQYVVVYDPNAGFVTGGGWITSAPGSYVADPALTGKASFGFVSKYQRGRTVPTGETQFQFEVAGFRFHSVSYEWLVVSGAKAQYKGQGTVNGAGDYGFLLTATDGALTGGGGVDKFRIKIWDRASGTVVYDNVLGSSDDIDAASPQALGGGSIVVHSK
jgi:hypothetical protein